MSADTNAALRRMETASHLLDEAVRVPGTNFRVGIDPLLGLLPVSGDLVSGLFSLYIVAEAARIGVTPPTLARMVLNVAVDTAGGSVPIAGDLFDATFKVNIRNVSLAKEDLGVGGSEESTEQGDGSETIEFD